MLILFAALGAASQIHYRDITLPEVVVASPTIVVVDDADPASRTISLPAGPVTMETRLMRLVVVDVLRAPEGQVSPGQVIEVGRANLEMQRMMVWRYHADGISKSPIYQRYQGSEVDGRRVVFLAPCGTPGEEPGLCLSVSGGVESIEKQAEITALITGE